MFQTIRERPRWAYALDILREHQVGEVVEYGEFAEVLDGESRSAIQAAVRDAGKRLLREDGHAVEAVPTVGYRVVPADEHVRLGRSQELRSRRAMGRGKALVSNVDMSGLTMETQRTLMAMAAGFARVEDFMRATNRSIARIGRAQEALESRVDEGLSENAARLARLEEQLAKLTTVET